MPDMAEKVLGLPDFADFIVTNGEQMVSQTMTLENPSDASANLMVSAMAVTGAEFSMVDNTCENQSLAINASCSFKLVYTPNDDVKFSEGNLAITTDHSEHKNIEIELFGSDKESLDDDGWYDDDTDAWNPNEDGGFDVNCDLLGEDGSAELGLKVTGPGRISFSASVAEGNRLAYSVDGKAVRQFRKKPDGGTEQHTTELGDGEHNIDFDFDGAQCSGDGIGDINIDVEGNDSGSTVDGDSDTNATNTEEEKSATITVAGAFNPLTLLVSLLLLPLLGGRRHQHK
jgi:hypothetical protein